MICPIMNSDNRNNWIECREYKCQWWTQDDCIVFDINRNLKDIAAEIHKGYTREKEDASEMVPLPRQ